MKLRNKETGEIKEFVLFDGKNELQGGATMKDLVEEWEDYEEPEGAWSIDDMGFVSIYHQDKNFGGSENYFVESQMKEIGNWFETREEAEKAVEKLKAWKRLKDKGFEIEGWDNYIGDDYYKTGQIVINLNNVKNRDWDEYDNIDEIKDDLNLLFGGEE